MSIRMGLRVTAPLFYVRSASTSGPMPSISLAPLESPVEPVELSVSRGPGQISEELESPVR